MRNKRLLIIFSIFVLIVLTALIGSAVFSLQNIEVVFKDEFDKFVSVDLSTYGGLNLNGTLQNFKGKNILVLDREELVKTVEKDNLWLGVLSTEAVFPDSLKITATVRTPVFHFSAGGSFYTCDYQGFVMSAQKAPDTLDVVSAELSSMQISVGTYLNCETVRITFELIVSLWRQTDEDRKFADIPHYIESVAFNAGQPLKIKTAFGAEILINEPSKKLSEKFTAVHGIFVKNPDKRYGGVFRTGYEEVQNADGNWVWRVSEE